MKKATYIKPKYTRLFSRMKEMENAGEQYLKMSNNTENELLQGLITPRQFSYWGPFLKATCVLEYRAAMNVFSDGDRIETGHAIWLNNLITTVGNIDKRLFQHNIIPKRDVKDHSYRLVYYSNGESLATVNRNLDGEMDWTDEKVENVFNLKFIDDCYKYLSEDYDLDSFINRIIYTCENDHFISPERILRRTYTKTESY